ncbi:MAG: SpoVA/SpoVAEb family sporulation membrane protein [Candidatus Merdivicinus sp.]|jgi:stage V sporulation protein AC
MKRMTKEEYGKLAKEASPGTKSWKTIPMAFLVGGGICTFGQLLLNLYLMAGMDEKIASMTVSVTLIFLSVLATALNVYDNLAKHAGAGTLVPITGFANSVAAPALEFKSEGLILGIGAKLFSIAGPVIVYGIGASCIYGILYYLFR